MTENINYESTFRRYLSALLEGDSRVGQDLISDLLAKNVALTTICRDYIQRSMYEVGALWERNEISVSIEHLAASMTQLILSDLFFKLKDPPPNAKQLIIACVPGEVHEIGALIVANVSEMAGWGTTLLGANMPTIDLVSFIGNRKPDMLALSCTIPANRRSLEGMLEKTVSTFPQLDILMGGQALGGSDEANGYRETLLMKFPRVRYVQTLEELESLLYQKS
jgi:methanogenic corrinoid protein MtbC1